MDSVNHTKNVVEVKDISFSYGNNLVLENISLDVHQGDYLGIIGPNGAGKTTLLKIMLGLLKPEKGSVNLFGVPLSEFKDWQKIGYVPQKATNFDEGFPVTVFDVVMMGRYGRRAFYYRINKNDHAIVRKSLQEVDMWEYRNRLIGDLSGGQQQRVFIARALATNPEIIFLDEPTSGIDQKIHDEFYGLLRKLNHDKGLTLVLISHDIKMITEEVMHIACIDRTLVCHTSPEEFLKESLNESQPKNIWGQSVKIIEPHKHNH
jgi:zinc transport system ATP-binding protein